MGLTSTAIGSGEPFSATVQRRWLAAVLPPAVCWDDSDFGFHRNAALGTTSTSVRFGSSNETLAVMYGNSFPSGLSASMMTK